MISLLPSIRAHFVSLCAVTLLAGPLAASAQSTVVRVQTTQGAIDLQLLDAEAPKTVANFLTYVRSQAWVDVMVHRAMPGFVVQTGGYPWRAGAAGPAAHITTNPPVVNEFSLTRSNLRGTVAMAKVAGNPDSATSEWFVNLADNITPCPPVGSNAGLDCQNGGFTVFARTTTSAMAVVDKIAALRIVNVGGAFTNLPVTPLTDTTVTRENVVLITGITEYPPKPGLTDSDRIFNFLEATFPQFVPVEGKLAGEALGYVFRYYPKTNSFVGTKDGKVWYLVPAISNDVGYLGTLPDLLLLAVTNNQ